MRAWLACLAFPLLCLASCADDENGAGAAQGCRMDTVADMRVLNDHGSPVIEAAINGTKVAFVVDTGARTSIIFEQAAEQLGLPTDLDGNHLLSGIGGSVFSRIVSVDNLSLGSAVAHHVELDSIPGGATRTEHGLPLVGLFGGDFLVNYDVEFDLPAHWISLYTEHHCSGNLRPWPSGAFYRLPFRLDGDTAITLPIAIDAHQKEVVLDSGAVRSIIDSDAGNDSGASRTAMQGDRRGVARGIDGNAIESHRHRFDSLDIGPEHVAPAYLEVADIAVQGLLGADFFRSRRVWVSYPHQVVYVQRVAAPAAVPNAADGSAASSPAPKH